jgi:hypothetical protein
MRKEPFQGIRLIKRLKIALLLMVTLSLSVPLITGCVPDHDFNTSLHTITRPYRFSIAGWEFRAIGAMVGQALLERRTDGGVAEVTEYFANVVQIKSLESAIGAAKAGQTGRAASLEAELGRLKQRNTALAGTVERIIEAQIREALSDLGIFNPIVGLKVGFPPVNFVLSEPPHVLVVSPRDRIESLREVVLLPDMSLSDMEAIEARVDELGVSSLVVEPGGMATYPSFVADSGGLRSVLDTAAEEWLHQYLAFTPLGFRYVLDIAGLRPDYEIATMNETLAGMVSQEIGAIIYKKYYSASETENATSAAPSGFDFNHEMREIRRAVDNYLARGEINQAEAFMEQKRQYLAANGYYIRKLNQAYFAFHGTYADAPTSISPIGAQMAELRSRSASLKDFLDRVSAMTGRRDLAESVK